MINKIGICANLEQLREYEKIICIADYVELPFSNIACLEQKEYYELLEYLNSNNLYCPIMTKLLNKNIRVVDHYNSFDDNRAYLELGFERASQLGTKIVVFGNAKSRNYNFYDNREEVQAHFIDFYRKAADLAIDYGISICIEPLNRTQSNFINTIDHAAEICSECSEDNIGIVLDYYHFQVEKDSWNSVFSNKSLIKHCHMASLLRRGLPNIVEQEEFFKMLKTIQYSGNISLEFDYWPRNHKQLIHTIENMKNYQL